MSLSTGVALHRNGGPAAFAGLRPGSFALYSPEEIRYHTSVPQTQQPQTTIPPADTELNEQQRAAVEHGEGPLLVVAGAGTGKTRVITERIRYLLETRPDISGENILGLTFTDKAAGEMLHRVRKTAGERAEGVWISTFHAFCDKRILREVNPDLRVLDQTEHWILLRRHMAELGLRHFKRLSEPGQFLNDFVKFFERCQDELVSPDDYQRYVEGLQAAHERRKASPGPDTAFYQEEDREEELERQKELARVYRTSEELLRKHNCVTFGGQIMQAVQQLRENAALLGRFRAWYRYLLVDEYQDTNIAQIELLWLLAGDQRNIFAVGDDDQAIYRFRGASFSSFMLFLERFCGVAAARAGADRHLVPLTQNYRSTDRILRIAGQVISYNEKSPHLPPKRLTTQNAPGEKIRIAAFKRHEEEAHWIASELERMHRAGQAWRTFAVLYRKHTHRDALVRALGQKQIPFVIRRLSILSTTIVRDLIAYLRLIAVPTDNVSWARVLAVPYWGFEPPDLVRLAERAGKARGASLGDILQSQQGNLPFTRSGARAEELLAFLDGFRQRAAHASAKTIFDELVAGLGLAPLPSDADGQNLERFARFLADWEKNNEANGLRDFIQYFEYFLEAEGAICHEEEPADDAVQLMTVHSAKGLEFGHVFLIQLSNGDFPAWPRRPEFEFPAELMKEEKPKGDFRIQEERRLFYVALTRARRQLTLSAVINKRKRESPFLEDILRDPQIVRADAQKIEPSVAVPPSAETAGPAPADASQAQLFGPASPCSRAYSRVALWAKAYRPPLPQPLQLSASAIDTYVSCPMKYLFQYAWGIRAGPQAAMTFGNVMHVTIREFVQQLRKRRQIPFEDVAAIYEREWSAAGYRDTYQEEEYRKAGREQLKAFYQTYNAAPADALYQEKSFALPLENDVTVTGRIDQINRLERDGVEIVDYKTGKPKQAKYAEKSLQLSIYALAAREVLELTARRLVFYNLTTNEAVATTRDAKALDEARKKVAEVASLIRAGEFPAYPGFLCRYCDFRPLCPAHEQLVSISPARA
jgi:DNA helicase-2/ATP-dependent DNA helicase PcrA